MGYDRQKQKQVSKKSHFNQGVIDPSTCKKLFESKKRELIKYQSGLELQFIKYCEATSSIVHWCNEPFSIKYVSRLDGKVHEYFPDFIIEKDDGKVILVETKPLSQCKKPHMTDSLWLKKAWIQNVDKWRAAKEFAEKNNMTFTIVTEADLEC